MCIEGLQIYIYLISKGIKFIYKSVYQDHVKNFHLQYVLASGTLSLHVYNKEYRVNSTKLELLHLAVELLKLNNYKHLKHT